MIFSKKKIISIAIGILFSRSSRYCFESNFFMSQPVSPSPNSRTAMSPKLRISLIVIVVAVAGFFSFRFFSTPSAAEGVNTKDLVDSTAANEAKKPVHPPPSPATIEEYEKKIALMVNGDTSGLWPVKTEMPLQGAILPYKRILAFYGNYYSKQMGILGELPPDQMLAKLQQEVESWQKADTTVEVVPALHYIAVTAQQSPGKGNKYRLRMPFAQIDSTLSLAKKVNGLVFIDVQVGHSTLEEEIPALEKYLSMPNVHLGIDPEFSMKSGHAPGKKVGSFDAADINWTMDYLQKLVSTLNLPPKILIVHRFTQGGVTNYKQIKIRPEVQFVMDMDGWGAPDLKYSTYRHYIFREPVQFTGFKLFYKNDLRGNGRLLKPEEVLALKPKPLYIQYQ